MTDGVHEVGFAQADTAVEQQRVVGSRSYVRCHLHSRSVCQLIRPTFHEGIERKLFIQIQQRMKAVLPER